MKAQRYRCYFRTQIKRAIWIIKQRYSNDDITGILNIPLSALVHNRNRYENEKKTSAMGEITRRFRKQFYVFVICVMADIGTLYLL